MLQTCPLTVTPLGIGKKCHSKRPDSYCVTVTIHLYYVNYQIGHQERVTVRGRFLTVSL